MTDARTRAEIVAKTDADLAAYIRAGERYRTETPGHARAVLDRRLQIARQERQRRADARGPSPTRTTPEALRLAFRRPA